jgi:hypothetical protein
LKIIYLSVPPNKPTIFDESGREVRDLIGPYLEGDTIVLKCIATGGKLVHFTQTRLLNGIIKRYMLNFVSVSKYQSITIFVSDSFLNGVYVMKYCSFTFYFEHLVYCILNSGKMQ